jgi:hypothetical protein
MDMDTIQISHWVPQQPCNVDTNASVYATLRVPSDTQTTSPLIFRYIDEPFSSGLVSSHDVSIPANVLKLLSQLEPGNWSAILTTEALQTLRDCSNKKDIYGRTIGYYLFSLPQMPKEVCDKLIECGYSMEEKDNFNKTPKEWLNVVIIDTSSDLDSIVAKLKEFKEETLTYREDTRARSSVTRTLILNTASDSDELRKRLYNVFKEQVTIVLCGGAGGGKSFFTNFALGLYGSHDVVAPTESGLDSVSKVPILYVPRSDDAAHYTIACVYCTASEYITNCTKLKYSPSFDINYKLAAMITPIEELRQVHDIKDVQKNVTECMYQFMPPNESLEHYTKDNHPSVDASIVTLIVYVPSVHRFAHSQNFRLLDLPGLPDTDRDRTNAMTELCKRACAYAAPDVYMVFTNTARAEFNSDTMYYLNECGLFKKSNKKAANMAPSLVAATVVFNSKPIMVEDYKEKLISRVKNGVQEYMDVRFDDGDKTTTNNHELVVVSMENIKAMQDTCVPYDVFRALEGIKGFVLHATSEPFTQLEEILASVRQKFRSSLRLSFFQSTAVLITAMTQEIKKKRAGLNNAKELMKKSEINTIMNKVRLGKRRCEGLISDFEKEIQSQFEDCCDINDLAVQSTITLVTTTYESDLDDTMLGSYARVNLANIIKKRLVSVPPNMQENATGVLVDLVSFLYNDVSKLTKDRLEAKQQVVESGMTSTNDTGIISKLKSELDLLTQELNNLDRNMKYTRDNTLSRMKTLCDRIIDDGIEKIFLQAFDDSTGDDFKEQLTNATQLALYRVFGVETQETRVTRNRSAKKTGYVQRQHYLLSRYYIFIHFNRVVYKQNCQADTRKSWTKSKMRIGYPSTTMLTKQ